MTELILLVEDEDSVRRVLMAILQRTGGYRVVEERGGNDALSYYCAHQHEVDLVITDCVMPGMSGIELANKLLAINPECRIVCMSGYPRDANDSGFNFLRKPITPDDLLNKVREMLSPTE